MAVFSVVYDALKQKQFEEALKNEKFTEAKNVLESFPKGYSDSEKIDRLVIINEGYKALFDGIVPVLEKYGDLEAKLSELEHLKELSTSLDRI